MKITSRKIPEYLIYILLWLIFLVIPFITNDYNREGGFVRIIFDWLRVLPFFIVFLVNNFWLMRKFLFHGRSLTYVLSLVVVVVVVSVSFQYLNPVLHKNDPKVLEQRIMKDPQFGREEMRLGNPSPNSGNAPVSPEFFNPGPGQNSPGNERVPLKASSVFVLINTLIISLLIAGFNTAIAVTNRWFTEEQARKEIEKEHVETKLEFLQNQVNPHFLMNTLNNIHSLIEVDQPMAQSAVLKLSGMMRYLLYESGNGTTTLSREIDFLQSYLELMALRVDKSIDVSLDIPQKINNVSLPPLLFITFIENAFKHGVSYREPSSISFKLIQKSGSLEFISENTIPGYGNVDSQSKPGGFGLSNMRKRLEMLYGDRFKLDIDKSETRFRARLVIPV
jgi:hypothetical protein